jgi:hypothetical protein
MHPYDSRFDGISWRYPEIWRTGILCSICYAFTVVEALRFCLLVQHEPLAYISAQQAFVQVYKLCNKKPGGLTKRKFIIMT